MMQVGYIGSTTEMLDCRKAGQEGKSDRSIQGNKHYVRVEGKKPLGAVIGWQEYLDEYISGKVSEWVGEVVKLAELAQTQPQGCYAAYTFSLKDWWTYFLRTLLDIQDLLEPGECNISSAFSSNNGT